MRPVTLERSEWVHWRFDPRERRIANGRVVERTNEPQDSVELSGAGRGVPDEVRAARIARLQAAVRTDSYVTEERIARVIDRLLEVLRA